MKTVHKLLIALSFTTMVTSAHSASSPWFTTDGAKMRLISLPSADGKTIDAGLQIKLEKGWKTYWRSPGSSGIPPEISFSGSQNIASSNLRYPVPIAFGDGDNLTAGYKGSVTFPIKIEPLFAGRDVVINVAGMLGICGEVCLPVEFKLSLTENSKGFSSREVAVELLRSRSNLMNAKRDDFHIVSSQYIPSAKPVLSVQARIPEGTAITTLHVEGPSDWYLTPVHASKIEGKIAHYTINFSDLPKAARPLETQLTFSLIADGVGVTQELIPTK